MPQCTHVHMIHGQCVLPAGHIGPHMAKDTHIFQGIPLSNYSDTKVQEKLQEKNKA